MIALASVVIADLDFGRCRFGHQDTLGGQPGVGQRYVGIAAKRFQFSLLAIHDHKRLGTGTDTQTESGRGNVPIGLLTRRGER